MDVAQVHCVTFNQLPIEILHQIAQDSEPAYRAMLAIPAFARIITIGKILDYMELFGHSVNVINYSAQKDRRIEWRRNGLLHRLNGPARINADGEQFWFLNGNCHRLNEPAAIYNDGTKHWYQNGRRNRLDGPASIDANGEQMWFQNGKRHRSDGPAIILENGKELHWYQDGKCHRLDGPAIITADGNQYWYFEGKYHRSGAPAIIRADGTEEWWNYGDFLFKQKTHKKLQANDFDGATCTHASD